jgi:RNase P/RNase MRP subunit p30
MATRLGISGLIFVYPTPQKPKSFDTKVVIKTAVSSDPRKFRQNNITIIKSPLDQEKIRCLLENEHPHLIYALESSGRTDFLHHRASGLNHILAQIALDKDISIGFSFASLLESNRHVTLGRMSQNISLAKKFKFRCIFTSFATSPWHMRSESDLRSVFSTLGANDTMGWKE